MSINMESFQVAYCSAFGAPSVDIIETIEKFQQGEDLSSEEVQVIDCWCAIGYYVQLEALS